MQKLSLEQSLDRSGASLTLMVAQVSVRGLPGTITDTLVKSLAPISSALTNKGEGALSVLKHQSERST